MDAEKVTEKILADAQAQAETILQNAKQTGQAQTAKLQENLADYNKQTAILAQKATEETEAHLLSAARMQLAKQLLAEKRRLLDEVFEQARGRLKELPDNEYLQLMSKLLIEAVQTGDEEVIVDKNEKRIDQNFIKQINARLGPSHNGKLRLSEEREEIGAGFILKQGKIKTNASVDVLLNQARKNLEIELAKRLFA
jgi:V/A-type H+-transporting ATPase subunit E